MEIQLDDMMEAAEAGDPSPDVTILGSENVKLTLLQMSGTTATFRYDFVQGAMPQTNDYSIYIWEGNAPVVPFKAKPQKVAQFTSDAEQGSVTVRGLRLGTKTYCIGVGTGPDKKDVVAALWARPAMKDPIVYATTSIVSGSIDTDTVVVVINTMKGFAGATNKGVLRLLDGEVAPVEKTDTIGDAQPIPTDSQVNEIVFSETSLAVGQPYVVGFYTDPDDDKWTSLAASLTFKIDR